MAAMGAVRRMIEAGLIKATQPVLYAPWAIDPETLSSEVVIRTVAAVIAEGKLPRIGSAQQLQGIFCAEFT
jgi:hypothetical protein